MSGCFVYIACSHKSSTQQVITTFLDEWKTIVEIIISFYPAQCILGGDYDRILRGAGEET